MQSLCTETRDKKAKLDHHTSNGIFVGCIATTKNIYYIDNETSIVKDGCHSMFDEAHLVPRDRAPLAAQALQSLGYPAFRDEFKNGKLKSKPLLRLKLITERSKGPARTNSSSIGHAIYTLDKDVMILPGATALLHTDIVADIQDGY